MTAFLVREQIRRLGWGLALAFVTAAVVGSGPAQAQEATPTPPQVRWHLVGVGPDGRSLLIHELRVDACLKEAPLAPIVRQASARKITIGVDDIPLPTPSAGGTLCTAESRAPTITFVGLGVPVAGQTIDGAGRVAPPKVWNSFNDESWPVVPRLRGLRIPDAVEVLGGIGIPKSRIRFKGPRHGVVIGQAPGPDVILGGPTTRLVLKTKTASRAKH